MSDPDGPPHDLGRLIEVLDRHGVEYLMVGGVAAIGYGAERPTEDADCVVRRERANLDRLADALRELNARLRVGGMADVEAQMLPVQIDGTTLDMASMSTWMTDAGPFDVLAGLEAPDGRLVPYEELAGRAMVLRGRWVRDPGRELGGHHPSQGAGRPGQGPRGPTRATRFTGRPCWRRRTSLINFGYRGLKRP